MLANSHTLILIIWTKLHFRAQYADVLNNVNWKCASAQNQTTTIYFNNSKPTRTARLLMNQPIPLCCTLQRRRWMKVAFSMSSAKRLIFKRNAVTEDAFVASKWLQSPIKTEPLSAKVWINGKLVGSRSLLHSNARQLVKHLKINAKHVNDLCSYWNYAHSHARVARTGEIRWSSHDWNSSWDGPHVYHHLCGFASIQSVSMLEMATQKQMYLHSMC